MTVSSEDMGRRARAAAAHGPAAGPALRGTRAWASRALREPLVHFLLIGFLIALGVHYWNQAHDRYTIRIGAGERRLLATKYRQQYGEAPSSGQLEELTAGYVREEISVREARALGLDRDDEVIRRRLAQKYAFLESDLAATTSPSPGALERWYAANRERYLVPTGVSFRQVYFSIDSADAQASWTRAMATLARLRGAEPPGSARLGDAFPGPAEVSRLTPTDAVRLLGDSELSRELFTLPAGRWLGPYRSGYGWHLLYVTGRSEPSLPELAQVRGRVADDYLEEARGVADAERYAALRAKYRVLDDAGSR